MERILEIEKYRNIGLNNKERVVLNNSLEKGKMGNLVIVIGTNNSGKSNVLDGLMSYMNKRINERDITTLSYKNEDRIPSVSLVTKDANDIYLEKISLGKETSFVSFPKNNLVDKQIVDTLAIFLTELKQIEERYAFTDVFQYLKKENINEEDFDLIEDKVVQEIQQFYDNTYSYKYYDNETAIKRKKIQESIDRFHQFYRDKTGKKFGDKNTSKHEEIKDIYFKRYGISFQPKIYRYEEIMIKQSSLRTTPSEINNNNFFIKLFKSIDMGMEVLTNAYKTFRNVNNKGILIDSQKEINKKLKNVSKKFNHLYYLSEDAYSFEISLETDNIYFILYRDSKNITFDYQSTGFKWFFNLYFNLLCSSELNPGDIIIMDEPATNLHVAGQKELRTFLKEFAIANDVVVVIATHSPFLIDMDYLDEIRVVKIDDNVAKIVNDFTQIDLDDPDSLSQIKKSLTISNHVLYNPDNKVVFVEGITDYNYMVAFKKIFGIEDLIFLPIKGIGKDKEKQKEISKRLIQIRKNNPILMVDSDIPGKNMKASNAYDSELTVFTLADIEPQFKEIEYLFSEEDIKKFGLKEQNEFKKSSSQSAYLKTYVLNDKNVSKLTKENFKKVFDYIEKL